MSETVDPLLLLRDSLLSGKPITHSDKVLEIGGMRVPVDAPTAWQRKDKKGPYTVGSLYYAIQMRDLKVSDYAKQAGQLKIPMVSAIDKRDIVDYFTGATQDCKQIDAAARAQTLIRKADLRTGRAPQAASKKRDVKAEEKKELMEVCDYVLQNEKKIHSRATVLQCQKKSFLKVLRLGYQVVKLDEFADKM